MAAPAGFTPCREAHVNSRGEHERPPSTGRNEKKVRLLTEAFKLGSEINKWFEGRYGHSYQDIDCDTLIDSLDYATGPAPEPSHLWTPL